MIPLTLKATNFRTYQSVEFDIPAGLTAVVGVNAVGDGSDSNGSGKSSLLELLPIALFGPSLPWSEYLTVGSGETLCTVELEFMHGGQRYLIKRSYDAKGRGKTTLDLSRMQISDRDGLTAQGWAPLTMSAQSETQRLIERTIGITEATFAHSVFAAQGARHFADPDLPPRERKAILAEALNLGVWDKLLKLVKADISEVQAEDAAIVARLGAFEEDLAQKDALEVAHGELVDAYDTASLALMNAESVEGKAREDHERFKTAAERLNALHSTLRAAEQTLTGLERQSKEAADAEEVAAACRDRIAELLPLTVSVDALEDEAQELALTQSRLVDAEEKRRLLALRAEQSHQRSVKTSGEEAVLRQAIVSIAAEIAETRAGTRPCGSCGQPLVGEALETAVASLKRDTEALETRAAAAHEEATVDSDEAERLRAQAELVAVPELSPPDVLEAKREALRTARAAVTEVATLQERLLATENTIATVRSDDFRSRVTAATETETGLQAKITEAGDGHDVLEQSARERLDTAVTYLGFARTEDHAARSALATSDERLRNLAALDERSQEALAARAGLQGRLEVLTALARSYGRDGIPALILEATAIPQLETEANRVLTELGARFRFELVTQRENKGGGIKDTLDVVVHGEKGALRYESYSGGEQTRLAFALRIALARLIASRRSAQAGVLILDELAFLDSSGIAAVCGVLRGLAEFRSILLVSHDDRFVDAFDQVVSVIRDEQGSRLETAA